MAYTSESPFRELMVIALLMPVIIAVVPDRLTPVPHEADVINNGPAGVG